MHMRMEPMHASRCRPSTAGTCEADRRADRSDQASCPCRHRRCEGAAA